MKCVIPEISWHNRDPVLSVDIQPKRAGDTSAVYRLASGGTDSHVLIWYVTHTEAGTINLDIAANLTRHQRPVNVVRWSPSGEFLASGDDESIIFVWKLKSDTETINILDPANEQDKEIWLTFKVLRGHMEDVYDLCWAPNSHQLISGSVDNTAMVWDVQKGKSQAILREHNSFVQGVAWDPQNQLLATLSSDRHFRVFDASSMKILSRSNKCALPVPEDSTMRGKVLRIFHDDTLQTFFRRLSFSPDGELIVTPSGVAEIGEEAKALHTTYIYTRYNAKQPALVLPSPDQYTVAVRFCPIFYKLHPHDADKPPVIELPYRMVLAVATKSSVILYDTQQSMPIGLISNIHYTRLTDLAWSHDGRILIVSSTDGFCTLITFAPGELGVEYVSNDEAKENNSVDNVNHDEKEANGSSNDAQSTQVPTPAAIAVKANPIAIRRNPRPAAEIIKPNNGVAVSIAASPAATANVVVVQTPEKVIALEIPTGIISTKDKFDSPEITSNKPATPISFRRAPRTADSPNTTAVMRPSTSLSPGHFNVVTNTSTSSPVQTAEPPAATTSNSAAPKSAKQSSKKAAPIAVRRHQRKILPDGGAAQTKVDASTTEEEAMDAWPIDEPRPETQQSEVADDKPANGTTVAVTAAVTHAMDVDETEDIRLVYDDESQAEVGGVADEVTTPTIDSTPNAKTPRRVELRTISTPKAKKKLL